MKLLVIFTLLVLAMNQPGEVSADAPDKAKRTEIHSEVSSSMASGFAEDVYALLPLDMKEYLKRDYNVLVKSSKITIRHNYWNKGVVSKEQFVDMCKGIKVVAPEQLAADLGATVANVFEAAMSLTNDDPFSDGLQRNLRQIMTQHNELAFRIDYGGYQNQTIEALSQNLYQLRQQKEKLKIYPGMVTLTADIWSAIWVRSGRKPAIESLVLVREPGMLELVQSESNAPRTSVNSSSKAVPAPLPGNNGTDLAELRRSRLERLERIRSRQQMDYESRRFNSSGNPR